MIPVPASGNSRLNDLLEAVKLEFDNVGQDYGIIRVQRDDLEQRLAAQVAELSALQQNLHELERAHQKIKQTYEDEIHRLRRELENRGHPAQGVPAGDDRGQHRVVTGFPDGVPPPVLGNGKGNASAGGVFSALMSGQGGPGSAPVPGGDGRGMQPPYMNGGSGPEAGGKRLRPDDPSLGHNTRDQPAGPPNPYMPRGDSMREGGPYMQGVDREREPTKRSKKGGSAQEEVYRQEQPPLAPTPYGQPSPYGHMSSHGPGAMQMGLPPIQQQPPMHPGMRSGTPTQGSKSGNGHLLQQNYPHHEVTGHCELDQDTAPAGWKKEGVDWVVVYNAKSPSLQKSRINVELVHNLEHGSVVCCVKFSPDGKLLATGCNRVAFVYDAQTGTKLSTLIDETAPKDCDLYIRSVCFSPDGKYLATGAEDRVIRVWDIIRRQIIVSLVGHEQDIYSLDWSRDGRVIVSGSGDKSVRVWDAETGKCLQLMMNNDEKALNSPSANGSTGLKDSGVTSVALSPLDGRCVAAGSLDEMVRVWDMRTGKLLERFEGHKNSVYSVAFSPDGRSIVSGSLDKTLKIWDLSPATLAYVTTPPSEDIPFETNITSIPRHTFVGHQDYVLSVAFAGRGKWLISGSKDRTVTFWDGRAISGNDKSGMARDTGIVSQFMLQGHKNSVISVALGSAAGLFATGSGDCRARIWRSAGSQNILPPMRTERRDDDRGDKSDVHMSEK
ncbi:WD40-repeat-containing domain protein [Fimicolochytrium jonesii]|uniref:WD40-repeat-containing domain protein n=1 Tax=Fimicolochytrium jonesii TaxID=1396493 RepID=UPI0022FF2DA0|nr:WD40-repeat-containing domain protein [Fimicolochytrium jonesii]KAI8820693.1 WD40-repeat-containing domain protein [Fimicolochytrium jonesii]